MHYKIKPIQTIFVIILISLTGMVVLQINWLNKAIEINKQLFLQKVDLSTKEAGEAYRESRALPEIIHNEIQKRTINNTFIDAKLKELIDAAFKANNLPLNYSYGIYKHQEKKRSKLVLVAGNAKVDLKEIALPKPNVFTKFGWTRLTCNFGFEGRSDDYHLAVFPSYTTFVINQIKGSLLLSVLLIIFILFGFYYMFMIINKQKKISEIKDDFINNLTHEFKTPIFSISLASKALRKSKQIKESQDLESYVDVIDNEGQRLKNQVDKILQLSLSGSDKFELNRSQLNLHELLKKVSTSFQLILNDQQGEIHFAFKAKQYNIYADEVHLKNVFYNIIDNAIKYTDSLPHITIQTRNYNGNIEINFIDKGMGMDKEKVKLIFDKFYRVPTGNIHKVKGFGVGLSYAKRIVELHKGEIFVSSKINKGTNFKVILPNQ